METSTLQFQHLLRLLESTLESASPADPAPPGLLETLAQWFDCQWATYWKVDSRDLVLRAAATWSEEAIPTDSLLKDTTSRTLALGEGTAGQVWRSGIPVCTSDLIQDMCLPRSLDARAAGLAGGIWFPIRTGGETFAVVELLGKHYWKTNPRLIDQLRLLGESIGRSLQELKKV